MNKILFRFLDQGQRVMLLYFLFYIVLYLLFFNYLGYQKASTALAIPTMTPAFVDLHVIVAAYDTIQSGGNPYLSNILDPWDRLYNYPKGWMSLGALGLDKNNLFYVGVLMGVSFLITLFIFFRGLSAKEGLYAALVSFSPMSFLVVERGNVDIIMFILLACAVLIYSKYSRLSMAITSFLILLTSFLKLYPIFSILMLLNQPKNIFLKLFLSISTLFVLYLLVSWADIVLVIKNTPAAYSNSYGSAFLPMHFFYEFLGGEHELKPYFRTLGLVIGNLIIISIAVFSLIKKKDDVISLYSKTKAHYLPSFHLGVGIFIGSFAISINWDYRLIFLLFTVPQLLHWYKNVAELKVIFFAALTLILVILQWSFFSEELVTRIMIVNELFVWCLVGVLIYLFFLSLPPWLNRVNK